MPLTLRLLITCALLVAVSLLALWLRDHPGMVQLDWLGYRLETPLAVLFTAFAIGLMSVGLLLYGLVRLSYFPLRYRLRKQESRFRGSLDDVTYALTSLAIADHTGALRHARLAEKHLGEHPLLELVRAHVARRRGDVMGTQQQLEKMLGHASTRMLAASALSHLAQREHRPLEALQFAQTAYDMHPSHGPNLENLFKLSLENEQWEPALLMLEKSRRRSYLSKSQARHLEALLYWQQAAALSRAGEKMGSELLIHQAFTSDPSFVPAALEHAIRQINDGQRRGAEATLKRAWKYQPHPTLAELFLELHATDTPAKLTKALQSFTRTQPRHIESILLRSSAAQMLKQWDAARIEIEHALTFSEEARLYRHLADIERGAGQTQAAQQALEQASVAKRDAGWVCDECAEVAQNWQLECPACGSFDRLHWRAPNTTPSTFEKHDVSQSFTIPYELSSRP